ncbi:hypothetical protein D3C77_686530 [compost metagenome]
MSNSTSSSGWPFHPPAALMRSSSYLTAARNIRPVEACGPDSVSIRPILTGAACADAAMPARHSRPVVKANFMRVSSVGREWCCVRKECVRPSNKRA